MPSKNFPAVGDNRLLAGRARRSFAGKPRCDLFSGSVESISDRRRKHSHPEKDNVLYISLLCDLYSEAKNREQRINLLKEINHVASNFII
jgi:hypothetical protein